MTGPRRDGELDGQKRLSRRHRRQWPLQADRHRGAGCPALHPLQRLHQSLPGLRRHRRPCLWLGLSRTDRRGADAAADRRRGSGQPAQRLDLLRPLRERVPGAHPAAQADAPLARARVRTSSLAEGGTPGPRAVELCRAAAEAVQAPDGDRQSHPGAVRARAGPVRYAALRGWLDALSRFPGTADRRHFPRPVGATWWGTNTAMSAGAGT